VLVGVPPARLLRLSLGGGALALCLGAPTAWFVFVLTDVALAAGLRRSLLLIVGHGYLPKVAYPPTTQSAQPPPRPGSGALGTRAVASRGGRAAALREEEDSPGASESVQSPLLQCAICGTS
jgi:hypothetical protein